MIYTYICSLDLARQADDSRSANWNDFIVPTTLVETFESITTPDTIRDVTGCCENQSY
jgi:hypothetical protein